MSEQDFAAVQALPPFSALLLVQRGPNQGARFLLDSESTMAGRHPKSDIFLDDVTVSRQHCEFLRHEGTFYVRDHGSLNGTYVNRERIDEVGLVTGRRGTDRQVPNDLPRLPQPRPVMGEATQHLHSHDPEQVSWPFDVSHEPTLKIGEVKEILSAEFPMLNGVEDPGTSRTSIS